MVAIEGHYMEERHDWIYVSKRPLGKSWDPLGKNWAEAGKTGLELPKVAKPCAVTKYDKGRDLRDIESQILEDLTTSGQEGERR